MSDRDRMLVVDGSNWIWRYYATMSDRAAEQATRQVKNVAEQFGYSVIVVAFDSDSYFRTAIDENYKSNRPPAEPGLIAERSLFQEAAKKRGWFVQADRMEADDILATFAKWSPMPVTLATQDKDALQCLVEGRVNVCRSFRFFAGRATADWVTEKTFRQKYGFAPALFSDYLAIVGDRSDSVAGVPGIGPKAGRRLVQTLGGVAEILENVDHWEITKRQAAALAQWRTSGRWLVDRKLVHLETDVVEAVEFCEKLAVPV